VGLSFPRANIPQFCGAPMTRAAQPQTRKTYPQNWTAYNEAQTNEKRQFQSLLHDLCKDLPTPPQTGRGQRRLPMSDAVFAAVFKVYSTMSARRFTSDLCDAQAKGYIEKVPHFNSVLNYLENPDLFPILTGMVERAALPHGKMFHYFNYRREDFLAHYHQRSNVESTVMMVKTKFGDGLKSKTDVAARNEVLRKLVCHDICCVISAMYELGIQPEF
jgi:hypothetical protein